jgi:hypothetical protein
MLRYADPLSLTIQFLIYIIACDYTNSKYGLWVPVLAILCDREKFKFFVYDSAERAVYSSGIRTGIIERENKTELFLLSIKGGKYSTSV